MLVRALSKDKAKYLVMFGLLAGALFTGIVGTLGARFVWDNGFHYALMHDWLHMDVGDVPEGPTSPDLEISTWIAYSCVPLGSYLMCFRFLQVAWSFWKTGEVPHADHGVKGVDENELDELVADAPTSAAAHGHGIKGDRS